MERKIWLITGISSGIGKALAHEVMLAGGYVIGTMRKKTQIDEFNVENHGKGEAILLDVTHFHEIDNVVSDIIQKHERVDYLVNNAGVGFVGAVEESSLEEVRNVFEANFFSALKMTQTVLPYMRAARSGHIFQISSHGGIKAFAGFGIYNASKFALEGFSEAMAQEVEPLGINVTIVEPGPFRTKFAAAGLQEAKTELEDYVSTAGTFRTKLRGVDGKQEGDPIKAAKAIIAMANREEPSLRLPLGRVALKTISMKLVSVQEDLDKNRLVAEGCVF